MFILIYLILLCWYKFSVEKKNADLLLYTNGHVLKMLLLIITFFGFFVINLRVLSLFRAYKVLDIKCMVIDFNILLFFVLLLSLRKLLIYIFKLTWFKLHYVLMSQNNYKIHKQYTKYYFRYIYSPAFHSIIYFYYFNFVVIFGFIFCIIYDIVLNALILDYTLWYFKYYSLFRLVYISYSFMVLKQSVLLDFYTYNLLYPGNSKKSLFCNFKDPEHIFLIEESKSYVSGVILEKTKFEPKHYGDTKKMAFFKKIES